jgi:hypothetical protein
LGVRRDSISRSRISSRRWAAVSVTLAAALRGGAPDPRSVGSG